MPRVVSTRPSAFWSAFIDLSLPVQVSDAIVAPSLPAAAAVSAGTNGWQRSPACRHVAGA
jgi:hypothetical protein